MKTTLLDLLHTIRGQAFPLILGGGYALYLKQLRLQDLGHRTSIPNHLWPRPRSTEDLDWFLQTDVVCSVNQMTAIRSALDSLGFSVVKDAKYMHFEKALAPFGLVKLDLLTGPVPRQAARKKLHIKRPRVRPRQRVELHAYLVDEAIAFDEELFEVPVAGRRSNGQFYSASVHVPPPFTFLLMKLHAFDDRKDDPDKQLGRHHALDLYRVIAMMTSEEYDAVQRYLRLHEKAPPVHKARDIVSHGFMDKNSIGVLRLREHALFNPEMDVSEFLSILHELFGG
ncbi:MAG: hypothetical protein ABIJ56_06495 [Pseudomonadota bacterium]